MRFLVLLFSLALVSCATPKSEPQAYYSGVYVPGKVEFAARGKFTSTASVFSKDNVDTAKKAAYARFMLEAKKKGYRYFEIDREDVKNLFGMSFKLEGQAFKIARYNGRTYRVDDVKKLLKGGGLVAIQRGALNRKKRVNKNKRAASVNPARSVQVPETAIEPAAEPEVIMAPVDITGSVNKDTAKSDKMPVSTSTVYQTRLPRAVSGIPSAVRLRRN